jgi:hypothetical protein
MGGLTKLSDASYGPSCRPSAAAAAHPGTIERPETVDDAAKTGGYSVVVFNNEVNTYGEVTAVLILATNCTYEEAYIETWEIDHLGLSLVHFGSENECFEAAAIIRQIGIEVEVRADCS